MTFKDKIASRQLRFHWMLPKAGEVQIGSKQSVKEAAHYRINAPQNPKANGTDLKGWVHFAKAAENAGIDGVLISFSTYEPDPVAIATAIGCRTTQLKFIIAFRSGLMQPPALVQQINTLSDLIGGRVLLNTVAGSSIPEQRSYGDFLDHDNRYDRAGEFLEICNELWRGNTALNYKGRHYTIEKGRVYPSFNKTYRFAPEIFVSGHSKNAMKLAAEHGSCWVRVIDTPEKLKASVDTMMDKGVEVCLRLAIICRETREEIKAVIEEVMELTKDRKTKMNIPMRKDSKMYNEAWLSEKDIWYSENIWAGFMLYFGPVWTTLVGTPQEIANAFIEYKKMGVSQFIISGFPELDEVEVFGEKIVPLVRKMEAEM